MNPIEALLALVVWPGGVCAAAALVGWLATGRFPRLRDAVVAIGLAGGFVASMYVIGVRPRFPLAPSEDAWQWVIWLAPAGAVLGILETSLRVPASVRVIARAAAGFGAAWLLLSPLVPHALDRDTAFEWAGMSAVATAALWSVLADDAPRASRLSLVLPLIVALPVAGAILIAFGHFAVGGQAALALATCVGATATFGFLRRGAPLVPSAAAPVVALVFTGLLASSLGSLNYGATIRFPLAAAVLLVASASCAVARSWMTALVLAVLAAGAASWFAHVRDAASSASSGGW